MLHTIWQPTIQRIAQHIQSCGAEPTHTIVLLPFAQLLPIARQQWAAAYPNSLSPRFETTSSWAQRLCAFVPNQDDIAFDTAADLLTAQRLLVEAGCKKEVDWLASRVCDSAVQLAPIAAAQAPHVRQDWAANMQRCLLAQAANTPHFEQRIASVALLWAGHSNYASDVLFEAIETTQALVILSGFQADTLTDALAQYMQQHKPQAVTAFANWHIPHTNDIPTAQVQYTNDLEEQAQCAAAAIQAAVIHNADNTQSKIVALVDNDRALSRRIRAILAAQGLAIRDETGWKLSTTVAASHIMAALQACVFHASSDQVISWLKRLPPTACATADIDAIEAYLRQQQLAQWQPRSFWQNWHNDASSTALHIQSWRKQLQTQRTLAQWLDDLRQLLHDTHQWQWFEQDHAGLAVLRALHWQLGCSVLDSTQKWSLSEFIQWVQHTLEGNQFKPEYPLQEQVALVPLAQILARPFAAVVVPGCDEKRLPAAPDPAGMWTAKQRSILGLATREQLKHSQRLAWQHLLSFNQVALLTSHNEDGAELLASPLLLEWQLAPEDIPSRTLEPMPDLRNMQTISPKKLPFAAAVGDRILPQTISASSYTRFSNCPYCFFVFDLLKLREVNELQDHVDKRDFGAWLHETLQLFHEALQKIHDKKLPSIDTLHTMLEQAAQSARTKLGLDKAVFLPYQSTWQQVAAGYLDWLEHDHAETQAQFVAGETSHTRLLSEYIENIHPKLAHIQLLGRIDRTDKLVKACQDAPNLRLIDYKTEASDTTKKRVKDAQENIQLALYAALLSPQAVRAAYLNIATNGIVQLHEAPNIQTQGHDIVQEIHQYLQAIAAGKPLTALGQGQAPKCRCHIHGMDRSDLMQEQT